MDKKKKIIILIILFAFISFNLDIAFSYSKYVSNNIWNHFLKSKEFYFSSDVLTKEKKIITNTMWDGSKTYFNISNQENDKVTKYDIKYNIKCSVQGGAANDFECKLNGTNKSELDQTLSSYQSCINNTSDGVNTSAYSKTDCEMNNYKWANKESKFDYYFEIIPLNDKKIKDMKVLIEVKSTSPYKTTLSGEFSYHLASISNDNINTVYKKSKFYDELLINNTYNENKCISIEWDTNEYRINNHKIAASVYDNKQGYINKVILNLNAKENKIIEFQKKNKSVEGDINNFTISEVNC